MNLNLDLIKAGVNLNDVDTLDITLQLMMKRMRTYGRNMMLCYLGYQKSLRQLAAYMQAKPCF